MAEVKRKRWIDHRGIHLVFYFSLILPQDTRFPLQRAKIILHLI